MKLSEWERTWYVVERAAILFLAAAPASLCAGKAAAPIWMNSRLLTACTHREYMPTPTIARSDGGRRIEGGPARRQDRAGA